MERRLMMTGDGSHTMFVHGMEEPYHSTHGALQESWHIFIKHGLFTMDKPSVRILELGFGTGLNALLTLRESTRLKKDIYYHTVEKYPLTESEYDLLNYESLLEMLPEGIFHRIHSCPWGENVQITDRFLLFKEKADFRSMNPPSAFNLVYFDAFSPDKQPGLWSDAIFHSIVQVTDPEAVLLTYSSKGLVRKTLESCGFEVNKVAGPPGKREIIRAVKRSL
ncbi:MAG: tRNA (5-methylaminomethyl-2-thiouridine)(34)-methyltransferase MnmD [Bacteroidales bacterium]|nr:tRNA (5-methylaminomethyl-2-thiouridine)(34)-methyltransferase MnmD [Bacteroidales bacterium]